MKKILVLNSYPRKNGYTARLGRLLCDGIVQAGGDMEEIDMTAADINHCTGCYSCWLITPGVCVYKDDMPALLQKFCACEMFVCISPLNTYQINGHLKLFLDRLFTMTKEGIVVTPDRLVRNNLRSPDAWPKKMAYLLVGALYGRENFAGAQMTMEQTAQGLNFELCGKLVRPESYMLPFVFAKPKTIRTIETAVVRAGMELVTQGFISAETEEKVCIPIADNVDHFIRYSTIYWEHARRLGMRSLDVDAVCEAVIADERVLLSEMARCADLKAIGNKKLVVQFYFTDKNEHFRITVENGGSILEEKSSDAFNLRIVTTTPVWSKVFKRQVNIRDALVKKQIVLEGDKQLFMRFDRFFPPPAT